MLITKMRYHNNKAEYLNEDFLNQLKLPSFTYQNVHVSSLHEETSQSVTLGGNAYQRDESH